MCPPARNKSASKNHLAMAHLTALHSPGRWGNTKGDNYNSKGRGWGKDEGRTLSREAVKTNERMPIKV